MSDFNDWVASRRVGEDGVEPEPPPDELEIDNAALVPDFVEPENVADVPDYFEYPGPDDSAPTIEPQADGDAPIVMPAADTGGLPLLPPASWFDNPKEMHFLLWDDQLGPLDLSCENGYIIKEYDLGNPNVREVVYSKSFDHGTFDLSRFSGPRGVSLNIIIRPTAAIDGTGAQWSEPEMRRRLVAYAQPWRRPVLVFSEYGDERVMKMTLRGTDAGGAIKLPRFNAIGLQWVAPDPIMTAYLSKCSVSTLNEAPDDLALEVVNEGNAPAHWTITIDGEIKSPSFSLDGHKETTLQLSYVSKIADVVEMDSRTKQILINGKPVGYKYLNDNSNWFMIPPGSHVVKIKHAGYVKIGYPYAYWDASEWAEPPYALPHSQQGAVAAVAEPELESDILPEPTPRGADAVLADAPTSYWRLGESTGPYADIAGVEPALDVGRFSVAVPTVPGVTPDDDAMGSWTTAVASPSSTPHSRLTESADLTVELWTRQSAGLTGFTPVIVRNATTNGWWVSTISTGGLSFSIGASPSALTVLNYPRPDLIDDEWHHAVFVYSQDTGAILYVDGELVATAVYAGPIAIAPFGMRFYAGPGHQLDEVAVYDHVLPHERVVAHYESGTSPGWSSAWFWRGPPTNQWAKAEPGDMTAPVAPNSAGVVIFDSSPPPDSAASQVVAADLTAMGVVRWTMNMVGPVTYSHEGTTAEWNGADGYPNPPYLVDEEMPEGDYVMTTSFFDVDDVEIRRFINPTHVTNEPPPPPWAWTTDVDPSTGLPSLTEISLCYYDTWT